MNISIVSLLTRTLASATPLALGGIGGLFGERAGVSNIGLEGTITFGAFAAVLGAYFTGSPWIGLLTGAVVGVLISLLHAYFCISLEVNQSVIGLAINILAGSVTVYLSSMIFNNKGYTANVQKLPSVTIPFLSRIPYIGGLFSEISVLTLVAIILAFAASYVLFKTRFGLHVIAAGEAPQAAFVMGVKVKRTQYIAVMLGGLTCGLAGSYLSISYLSQFVRNMVAGRGFIAMAAIIFGRYHPVGVLLAALFFGFADALQMSLQGTVAIPQELVQCLPYLLTIAAVAFNEWRSKRRRLSITT